MKIVYQTNFEGFFTNETFADPDPMEEDNWIIPAGCVEVAPPKEGMDRKARWNDVDGKWELVKVAPPVEELEDEKSDLTITPRQLRTWLVTKDIDADDIEQAIKTTISDVKERKIVMIDWEYALAFHRGSIFGTYLPRILNITEDDVDKLFREAKKI
jgi:hypothetical protein